MTIIKYSLAAFSLLFGVNSMALNLANVDQTATSTIYDSRSCHELYAQASALEQDSYIYKSDFYSDKGTQMAAYAMTIFSPAVYYFGFKAYKDYEANVRSAGARDEISVVRQRMAEKRCFERH